MLLFSATYEQQVMTFATKIIADPVIIRLRREEESLDNIKQYYVMCDNREQKYEALANLYGVLTIGQSMVFCHVSETLCRWSQVTPFKASSCDPLLYFFVHLFGMYECRGCPRLNFAF